MCSVVAFLHFAPLITTIFALSGQSDASTKFAVNVTTPLSVVDKSLKYVPLFLSCHGRFGMFTFPYLAVDKLISQEEVHPVNLYPAHSGLAIALPFISSP